MKIVFQQIYNNLNVNKLTIHAAIDHKNFVRKYKKTDATFTVIVQKHLKFIYQEKNVLKHEYSVLLFLKSV